MCVWALCTTNTLYRISVNPYDDQMSCSFDLESNKIVRRGDEIWTLDGSVTINPLPPPLSRFPTRMVILRLEGGELLVWSPFPPIDEVMNQIECIGDEVRFVVAPNSIHWVWAQSFTEACRTKQKSAVVLCVAPGLPNKQEAVKSRLKWDCVLPGSVPKEWSGQLVCQHIRGIPETEEIVLLHVKSRTLIVADLVFNFLKGDERLDAGAPMKWYLNLVDGYRSCSLSRSFRYLINDTKCAQESIEEILEWDFQQMIMAHGLIVKTSAKEKLKRGTLALLKEFQEDAEKASERNNISWLVVGAIIVGFAYYYYYYCLNV